MQPNMSMNIKWGQVYEYFIFSKYISHKKEINVNNLTRLWSELSLPTNSLEI